MQKQSKKFNNETETTENNQIETLELKNARINLRTQHHTSTGGSNVRREDSANAKMGHVTTAS